jgi:hypothetical protein
MAEEPWIQKWGPPSILQFRVPWKPYLLNYSVRLTIYETPPTYSAE